MSRTNGRFDSDLGYADGMVDLSPADFSVLSGTGTLTRNVKGNISLHLGNSQVAILATPLSHLLFRSGVLDDLQERFGSGGNQPGPGTAMFGTGSALHGSNGQLANYPQTKISSNVTASAGSVNIPVINSADFTVGMVVALAASGAGSFLEYQSVSAVPDTTHITVPRLKFPHTSTGTITGNPFTTPAGVTGRPPFTGVTELTPVSSARPKGISFYDLQVRYTIAAANLVTHTVGLTKTVYANATALAITDVLAAAANGLTITFAATPYNTRIALANGYQVTDNSEYWLEMNVTTGIGGTYEFYGAQLRFMYNYS